MIKLNSKTYIVIPEMDISDINIVMRLLLSYYPLQVNQWIKKYYLTEGRKWLVKHKIKGVY